MDLFEAIKKRHACRSYDPSKSVNEEDLEKIIEAGKMAPSAGGLADQRFTVVMDLDVKKRINEEAASNQRYNLFDAAAIIVVSSDVSVVEGKYEKRGVELYAAQNVAAAVENILLAATALGLGSCWVGSFDEDKVKEILELEDAWRPMTMVPIGYAL